MPAFNYGRLQCRALCSFTKRRKRAAAHPFPHFIYIHQPNRIIRVSDFLMNHANQHTVYSICHIHFQCQLVQLVFSIQFYDGASFCFPTLFLVSTYKFTFRVSLFATLLLEHSYFVHIPSGLTKATKREPSPTFTT